MTVRLLCGQCRRESDIDEPFAGAALACPHCKHEVRLPGEAGLAEETALTDEDFSKHFAVQAKKVMPRKVRTVCGRCKKQTTVSARFSGKVGRCPSCKAQVHIPYPDDEEEFELAVSAAPEQAAQEIGELQEEAVEGWEPRRELVAILEQMQAFARSNAHVAPVAHANLAEAGEAEEAVRERWLPEWFWKTAVAATVAVVLIILAPAVYYWLRMPAERAPPQANNVPRGPVKPASQVAVVRQAPQPESQPQVQLAPAMTAAASVKVQDVSREVFAAGGYFPARPDRVYWKVKVVVTAGDSPLEFTAGGPDAALRVGGQAYPCLGVPGTGEPPLHEPVVAETVRVPAGATGMLVLVFEAPDSHAGAALAILGVPDAAIGPSQSPSPSPVPEGTYVEAPPRNLKPLLRDPVMGAIQTAANHELQVRANGKGLAVSIPAAGVEGTALAAAGGLYEVNFRRDLYSLSCKLRPIDGGKRLILYLADVPFYQITYERR